MISDISTQTIVRKTAKAGSSIITIVAASAASTILSIIICPVWVGHPWPVFASAWVRLEC